MINTIREASLEATKNESYKAAGNPSRCLDTLFDLGRNNFDRQGEISRPASRSKPTAACKAAASAQRSVKVLGHMGVRS